MPLGGRNGGSSKGMCLGMIGDLAGSVFSFRFIGRALLSKRGGDDVGEQFSFSLKQQKCGFKSHDKIERSHTNRHGVSISF